MTSSSQNSGLQTEVQWIRRVGPRNAELLAKLDIRTVEDLLYHFPLRYEDRRRYASLAGAELGSWVVVRARVLHVREEVTRRRRMKLIRVEISDGTAPAELVFFNQPWLGARFGSLRGREIVVFGQLMSGERGLQIATPEWEPADGPDSELHTSRIVPIHPATQGIVPRQIRTMVWTALEQWGGQIPDLLPEEIRTRLNLPPLSWSLRRIHFPDDAESLNQARRRLAYEELFRMQCVLALRREELVGELPGVRHQADPAHLAEIRQSIPFDFTGAQVRVIDEIRADMHSPHPMNRLLQGDVGSGKTAVAAAAVVTAVRSGYQVAIMAPTELLAEQHYAVFAKYLDPLNIRLHRLAGSVRAKGKRLIKEDLKTGFVPVVVGTHALLQEDVQFRNLGLVIVDEQHRFGVLQRLALLDKGMIDHVPDMLVMTATPIPRTLALTVYGDLEVSIIDEMPPGRKPIRTHWKRKHQRDAVLQGLRKLIEMGQQVYYLCPLVTQSEKLQAQAATQVFEDLRDRVFPDLRIGLIHGQMPSHEKDASMDRFRAGEVDILVATVVIEVGVDVPNATCMVIEDAERFGLAQLHQLRGRVGRGEQQSFCVLLGDPQGEEGEARLRVMTETTDGFRIAEEDLRLRGPGEFLGTRQSGLFRLRIANIQGDEQLLRQARADAFDLVRRDPRMVEADHPALAADLRARYGDLMLAASG